MIRIAICDDDREILNNMNRLLYKYQSKTLNELSVELFADGIELYKDADFFDIYILDIITPNITGIELAKKIRKSNESTVIIFLTSSPDFALESYDVSAFAYLMKPVVQEKLFKVLDKAILSCSNKLKNDVVIKTNGKIVDTPKESIEYVEVKRDKLVFYLCNGEVIETYGTISDVEKQLTYESGFIKPHRSFIVNMNYIKEINNKDILVSSRFPAIPVSKKRSKEIKTQYLNYMVYMAGRVTE